MSENKRKPKGFNDISCKYPLILLNPVDKQILSEIIFALSASIQKSVEILKRLEYSLLILDKTNLSVTKLPKQ